MPRIGIEKFLDLKDCSEVESLEERSTDSLQCPQPTKIGFTVSMPRTKRFTKMTSGEQVRYYGALIKVVLKGIKLSYPKTIFIYKIFNEHSKDGNIHIHGTIETQNERLSYPHALVCDIAKIIHRKTGRTYHQFGYSDKYIRYKSPLCVIQYIKDKEEDERWEKYIKKEYIA